MNISLRPYATTGIALVGASLIAVTPVAGPSPNVQTRAVQLADREYVSYLDSGSFDAFSSASTRATVLQDYVQSQFPEITHIDAMGQPAQLYPLASHDGFLNQSEEEATNIMHQLMQIQASDGHDLVMVGESGGATESSMEMRYLASLPPDERPPTGQLQFVLIGDPNNPNGGMLDRFDIPGIQTQTFPALGTHFKDGIPPDVLTGNTGDLTLPTIGITFNGPTPVDTPYETTINTGFYDGFADYPKYPLDLLADMNGIFGISYDHDIDMVLPKSLVEQSVIWEPSAGYDGNITWLIHPDINNNTLPILDPIYGSPLGDAIIDLLQPDMRILINLGYGADNLPYSQHPNVFTPIQAGLPDVNPATLFSELGAGAHKGITDFMTALSAITPSDLPADMLTVLTDLWTNFFGFPLIQPLTITPLHLDSSNIVAQTQIVLTDTSNALATVLVRPVDALMPFSDTLAVQDLTIPTYEMNLGLLGLAQLFQGNLSQALTYFGDIPAAATGLDSIAALLIDLPTLDSFLGYEVNAIESGLTVDLDFLAGLPGLL